MALYRLQLVRGDVGLGNVDNTSDANKPVSTAQQAALDGKVPIGARHIIARWWGLYPAASVAANRLFYSNGMIDVGANNTVVCALHLDPATIPTITGKTKKLEMRGWIITNAVAPACNFTFHLSPVATWGGASGAWPTVASLSAATLNVGTITTPGATTRNGPIASSIDFPSAGWYVFGPANSGTLPAGSLPMAEGELSWYYE